MVHILLDGGCDQVAEEKMNVNSEKSWNEKLYGEKASSKDIWEESEVAATGYVEGVTCT